MPDQTPYAEHRRNGTWPPLDYIDVLPGDTRGGRITNLIRHSPDGPVFAGVVFPDGHREVHQVVDPNGLLNRSTAEVIEDADA